MKPNKQEKELPQDICGTLTCTNMVPQECIKNVTGIKYVALPFSRSHDLDMYSQRINKEIENIRKQGHIILSMKRVPTENKTEYFMEIIYGK